MTFISKNIARGESNFCCDIITFFVSGTGSILGLNVDTNACLSRSLNIKFNENYIKFFTGALKVLDQEGTYKMSDYACPPLCIYKVF